MSLYKIEFTQIAIKTVSKYKKSNPVQYKKLAKLLLGFDLLRGYYLEYSTLPLLLIHSVPLSRK